MVLTVTPPTIAAAVNKSTSSLAAGENPTRATCPKGGGPGSPGMGNEGPCQRTEQRLKRSDVIRCWCWYSVAAAAPVLSLLLNLRIDHRYQCKAGSCEQVGFGLLILLLVCCQSCSGLTLGLRPCRPWCAAQRDVSCCILPVGMLEPISKAYHGSETADCGPCDPAQLSAYTCTHLLGRSRAKHDIRIDQYLQG